MDRMSLYRIFFLLRKPKLGRIKPPGPQAARGLDIAALDQYTEADAANKIGGKMPAKGKALQGRLC